MRCIDVGAEGSPAKQAANEAGGTQDITPGGGVPTVFMARDQPSPHHLVRCRLLPHPASSTLSPQFEIFRPPISCARSCFYDEDMSLPRLEYVAVGCTLSNSCLQGRSLTALADVRQTRPDAEMQSAGFFWLG